ncbi:MAG: flavodoxin domain-containing protein [Gaiellales bacterium]
MKAVVVFESLYGNTHAVADAVADGLRQGAEVEVVPVTDAAPQMVAGVDLLVVGGPTHVHGLSSNLSRKGAADGARKKGHPEPDVHGPALRTWFDGLEKAPDGRAAAFDTRAGGPKLLTGSAAGGISRRLRHHGYEVVGEESFVVEDMEGPLRHGELERAREWGRGLAAKI